MSQARSSPTPTAEVVGAGIGGLTAAAALARRGWSVRLHERDGAVRAFGSGIYLWSNGLCVLDDLGVLEQAVEGAHHGPSIQTRNRHNRVLAQLPTNGPGQVQVLTVLRERLISALLTAATEAGVEIVTGSTVESVDPSGSVALAGGGRHEADLVVVADGVGSRLRGGLGLLSRRRRLGQRCARVLIPRDAGLLPVADADHYIEWMSGRRFLLYTPSSATDAYIALVCPEDDHEAMGTTLPRGPWERSFPHAASIIARLGEAPRWDEFEWIELRSWSTGTVAVLGDAAHAQPPYLGQGGGCAMMAASGLAHEATTGAGTLSERLTRWERTERPLIRHTQRFAYRVGLLNDVPDLPRTALLTALGRSRAFGRSRLRAAHAVPTGVGAGGRS
jgi:2-polyprenyl-6-methoxyphenol hydroxylase-like FAD-dependent oxidoreductase